MNDSFHLLNTKRFFIVLILAYFILPALTSHFIFEGNFYIYSESQDSGDLYSALIGVFMLLWVGIFFPKKALRYIGLVDEIATSRLFRWIYNLFMVYLLLLTLYGLKLRMGGSSREELLDGMDNFLLPGMSYLLLGAAVVSVASRSWVRLTVFVVACVIVDMTFNGKIFSFLAAATIFFRMDYAGVSRKISNRVWKIVLVVGPLLLFIIGLSRIVLSGASLEFGLLTIIYTFASEFLGVEASVGWAIDYYNSGQSASLLAFASSFQDSYISEVGHGLALSPVAFFVGNFGPVGVLFMIVSMLFLAWFTRMTRAAFTWVIFLIFALNFQHFMRHGFNVFIVKIITQALFFYMVVEVTHSPAIRGMFGKGVNKLAVQD